MKIKTVLISTVVTAALIGGVGYGAYYSMQGKQPPVEVVPVTNVNMGFYAWDMQETIYGSVTSQIAQTVSLNDEYAIDEIFVKEGDKVKEGTPLFSYDMTLQELELEMQQLDLQTNELTMTRLEKELDKLKRTPASASLVRDLPSMTALAEGETQAAAEPAPASASGQESLLSDEDVVIPEEQLTESDTSALPDAGETGGQDGIEIEGIEQVGGKTEGEMSAAVSSVLSYERLVLEIQTIFLSCEDQLRAADIGEPIRKAVAYYRKNLADEKTEQIMQEDGSARIIRTYVIKESVRDELDKEAAERLEKYSKILDGYQVRYVEMLIGEAASVEKTELPAAVRQIHEAYELLADGQQGEVRNLENLRILEALAREAESEQNAGDTSQGGSETQPDSNVAGEPSTEGETSEEKPTENVGEPGTETQTEPQTGTEQQTETQSETGQQTETQPGTGQQTETQSETGQQTEIQSESENQSESETSAQSESETRRKFVLTVRYPAVDIQEHYEGDTVTIQADMDDVTLEFLGWKLTPMPETLTEENLRSDRIVFVMPSFDLTAEAQYQNAPDAIESYAQNFLTAAEELLAENAEQSFAEQSRSFLTELENTIAFYQQWLALLPPEILESYAGKTLAMEDYQLKSNVRSFLKEQGKKAMVQQMKDDYKELCLLYAKKLFQNLNPDDLDKDLLDKALEAYHTLGDKWREELEERWQQENAVQTDETDENGEPVSQAAVPAIGDYLAAYEVLYQFQEYLKLPPETGEDERYIVLQNIWNAFLGLTEQQQMIVSSNPLFVETMKEFGLWEDLEPDTEMPDYGGWGDGGYDNGPLYTAEELREMIWQKEQEIKTCELDIRQSELDLKQKQRVLDGKIVKSTMDGTVISIGSLDGSSDEDYFLKVANEAGLYARGAMSELALEKLHVGDVISGTLMTNGSSFNAVIKEISEYPDANAGDYGGGNSNASYYPFYALIEDTTDMEEGDAEIYLSASAPDTDNAIFLENYFIRSESDGRSYVYKQDDDGRLTKQYVKTGKKMYGYAIEIAEGLDLTDRIAFPYGKNVVEGAKTKEVDRLQSA